MKRAVILIAAIVAITLGLYQPANAAPPSQPPAPAPAPGPLVWSDEFNVHGAPANPAYWNVQQHANGDYTCVTRRPENTVQYLGVLAITARYEPDNTICPARDYTASAMRSVNTYGYGRIEARVKLPAAGTGTWPAFWMVGPGYQPHLDGIWDMGEIDVMEFLGKHPDRVNGAIHSGDRRGRRTYQLEYFYGPFANQWHTFAVDHRAGRIDWIIDGMIVWTQTPADVRPGAWDFDHQNWQLRVNMQVGGWGGTPNPADFPRQYLVDYVRVYGP